MLDLLGALEGNSLETESLSDLDDDNDPNILKDKSIDTQQKVQELSEQRPKAKKRTLSELLKEKEGYVSESEGSDQSSEHESLSDSEAESTHLEDKQLSGEESETKDQKTVHARHEKKKPKVWEDIYGRLRDQEGNVIKSNEVQKYVPPGLRKSTPNNEIQEQLRKIKSKLTGLLNR